MAYFDLEYTLRTDHGFRERILSYQQKLKRYRVLASSDKSHLRNYRRTLEEFIKTCHYNLVMLTPSFFPRYPKDRPLAYWDYPFAFPFFNFQIGGYTVVKGSRQIGKSIGFSARQLMHADFYPGFHSLYVVPRPQQLVTYANKLREVERAYAGGSVKQSTKLRKNLNYKEFQNKSTIELIYVLTDAGVARGKSADEILYDEFQDFDPDLEVEVDQIQRASEMPITFYSGTSLTTDTALEQKWQMNSQGVWVMKCTAGHENIPLPEHGVMDMIQPKGPSCYKCGKLLDVRGGHFEHADPKQLENNKVGVHIPQLIAPSVYLNPRRWADIVEKKLTIDIRKFFQEILGIATEQGEREITKTQLQAICTLGKDTEKLVHQAQQNHYQWVISGCDWGGSDYIPAEHIKISTTVHAILGVTFDRKFDILHFKRYSGMDYDDIVANIIANHQRCRGDAMASDFGVGAVYNSKLREHLPPERHLIFNYVGPDSQLIDEPKKAHLYNQWSLNKTESISMTYDAVRNHRIRCYDWDYASAYLLDFLNMYRAPAEKAGSGATSFTYHASASKPNDALQAVNYAYMLGKLLLGEPMFADLSVKIRLENTLRSGLNYVGIGEAGLPQAFSR